MRYKLTIMIPKNHRYKELEIEANDLYEANEKGNEVFQYEFKNSGKNNGSYFIEQI